MKRIILIIILIIGYFCHAQTETEVFVSEGYAFKQTYTSAELSLITTKQLGDYYFDSEQNSPVFWNGTEFIPLSSAQSFTTAELNSIPNKTIGSIYYDETQGRHVWWNGTSFESLNSATSPDASDVVVTPSGNLTSINAQDAFEELQADIDAFISGLQNVVEDTTPQLGGSLDALDNDINNINLLEFQNEALGANTMDFLFSNITSFSISPSGGGKTVDYSFGSDIWIYKGSEIANVNDLPTAGTDDQTLVEVLTEGSDAGGLDITNLNNISADGIGSQTSTYLQFQGSGNGLDMNGNELEMDGGNIGNVNGLTNNGSLTQDGTANFGNQVTIVGGSGGRFRIEGTPIVNPEIEFQYDDGTTKTAELYVDRSTGDLFYDADTGASNPVQINNGGGSVDQSAAYNWTGLHDFQSNTDFFTGIDLNSSSIERASDIEVQPNGFVQIGDDTELNFGTIFRGSLGWNSTNSRLELFTNVETFIADINSKEYDFDGTYDDANDVPTKTDIDAAISGLGSSTYTAPENFILSTGVNVLTDANIHNGAASIINVLNVSGTATAEISNLNPTEIDVFYFVVDLDGAILELTSSGTWSDSEIGTSTAIRLTGKGAKVGIEETAANSNEFRILAGNGVSYFTPDATPPLVTSATIENANPDQLVAIFDESVDIIDVTGLSLDSGLSGLTFTGIISNVENSITFQLSGNAANGDAGNFVYGGTNTITDTEGNALVASSTAVTNNIAGTTNLFDGANAGDPENEVDGTANTGTSGGSPGIITSVSGDATDGTFALRLEHNNGASGRAIHYIEINSTFQASSTYQIQFDVKEVAGDASWEIAFNDADGWISDTTTALNETSGWTTVTVSKATLASFAGNFRFRIQTDAAAAAGDAVLVDNFRVTIP